MFNIRDKKFEKKTLTLDVLIIRDTRQ